MIPELARHYEIDVIVNQPWVSDPWIKANLTIRDWAWFDANADRYDRVLYHFGNSTFHSHMFELLERHPGCVVLHDFYLSGILGHLEMIEQKGATWTNALYDSHGYGALIHRSERSKQSEINNKYPCCRHVLEQATGVIVHSEFSRNLAARFFGAEVAHKITRIPLLRVPQAEVDRAAARKRLGFKEDDFVVCSFGLLSRYKLNDQLLSAWLASPLAAEKSCHLVFVGENEPTDYGARLLKKIGESASKDRITITGFADAELYRGYLAAADVGVQLRTHSRGETSAAVMDCMGFGLPVVVNAHGTSAELPDEIVEKLSDECPVAELAAALVRLRNDPARRKALGSKSNAYMREHHDPAKMAKRYAEAIERFDERSAQLAQRRLAYALARVGPPTNGEEDPFVKLASAMAENQTQVHGTRRQLLVDITLSTISDRRTGIQRVVRSVLWELLKAPPEGFDIEPVYCTEEGGYYYAREFMSRMIGGDPILLEDEPIETRVGDCFLGLDLDMVHMPQRKALFMDLRNRGVRIFFVVYDLLPILRPDCFIKQAGPLYLKWIETIASVSEGLMCISRSVADELLAWLKGVDLGSRRPLKVGYFHLGADIAASLPTHGIEKGFEEALARMSKAPVFLMVGTVEPRKGHAQTLAAFEQLWARKVKARLVIVGTCGWMVEALSKRLRKHEQLGKNLFWFEKATDEMLVQLYEQASAMVIASEAEGFGLPLIEAAQHKLPIIARDIPVFREIAGEHALYFSGTAPDDLARAIQRWLALFNKGEAPSAENMPWQRWTDTADQIKEMLLCGDWYQQKDGALADGLPDYAGTRKQTAFVTA
ncbi:MAG: glycosyltransferase [Verrucomicrobiota bacterium]